MSFLDLSSGGKLRKGKCQNKTKQNKPRQQQHGKNTELGIRSLKTSFILRVKKCLKCKNCVTSKLIYMVTNIN